MKTHSDFINEELTKVYEEFGCFYAFSNKQFLEQRKEGVKYAQFGSGLIGPADKGQEILTAIENAITKGAQARLEAHGATAIIEYEYFNHETQITGDLSDMKAALGIYREIAPDLFTDEIISKAAAICYQKAVENDWF